MVKRKRKYVELSLFTDVLGVVLTNGEYEAQRTEIDTKRGERSERAESVNGVNRSELEGAVKRHRRVIGA